jgi:hypothetical protein
MFFMQVCANRGETNEKRSAAAVEMEIRRRIRKAETIRLLSLKSKMLLFTGLGSVVWAVQAVFKGHNHWQPVALTSLR